MRCLAWVENGKRIILSTLRGMSTFEFLPRITFEGNVSNKRIFHKKELEILLHALPFLVFMAVFLTDLLKAK
jgi:hypothetical protein